MAFRGLKSGSRGIPSTSEGFLSTPEGFLSISQVSITASEKTLLYLWDSCQIFGAIACFGGILEISDVFY